MLIRFSCKKRVPTVEVPTIEVEAAGDTPLYHETALSRFIARHEGLRLVCYLDAADVPTIGYGHTATVGRADVGVLKITKDKAHALLLQDIKWASMSAYAITGYSSGNVHDAITSFIFNLGPGALHGKSTQIGRHLLNKDYTAAYYGMQKYVFGGGRRLNGLVTRRKEEGEMLLATK
tara:strand:+ start:30408 stop:30938 length:531 start_codon:yes stop_codon:yes gene_type:complete